MKIARIASVGALGLTASLGLWGSAAQAAPSVSTVASATTIAAQAPALATGLADCPSSYLCFWYLQNYSSYMGKVSGNNANWGTFPRSGCPSGTWSNCAESAYNHGVNCSVFLFDLTGYAGGYHSLARGDRTPNMFGDYLNKVSSNRWCSPV